MDDLNGVVEPVGGPLNEPTPNPSPDAGTESTPSSEVTPEPEAFTDLNVLTPEERESPRIKKAIADYFAKTREIAPYRKLGEELGMSPEEIRAAIQRQRSDQQIIEARQRSDQQIVEALQKLTGGNKEPESELPPELRTNPILTDPDFDYAKQAFKYIAEQQMKPLADAQAKKEQAETIREAQSACGEFVKANPELGLTAQQLYDTCVKGRHNPFTQLYQAAIDAAGGPDKFFLAKNKKFLEDYQEQAKQNRRKSGTVVSPTAPVGTSPEPPANWDEHRDWIHERWVQNARLRQERGG